MDTLDPQVVNLAKAIRQSETGGKFDATGDGGNSYGAYQFQKGTWDTDAQKYGVNADWKSATKEQQNEVAYKQIKEWKDQGKNVGQIASMWNAGAGEPDAYKGTFSNGQPSVKAGKFDVPKYAKSVADAYQKLKNGGTVGADPNNPSSTVNPDGSPKTTDYKNQYDNVGGPADTTHTGFLGTNPKDSLYGKVLDNSVTNRLINAVPGAKDLGEGIGDSLAYFGEKAKGLFGGKDNSQYVPEADIGKTALGAAKVMGTAGLIGAGGVGADALKAKATQMASKMAPDLLAKVGGIDGLIKKYLIYKGGEVILNKAGGGAKAIYDHFVK